MPSSSDIVRLLEGMATELPWLGVSWHAVLLVAAVMVVAGWRPATRLIVALLVALSLSVSAAALVYGNPFNAVSFGVLAALLSSGATLRSSEAVERGAGWTTALGACLLLYGWLYPAFNSGPWYRALYAAPIGVVPCPTLGIAAGATLLAGGLRSRRVVSILAVWTTLYAALGIFWLGVMLDTGLLAASGGLIVLLGQSRAGSRSECAHQCETAAGPRASSHRRD